MAAKRDKVTVWRDLEDRHRAAVQRNYERSEMLRAIAEAWDKDPRVDPEYLRGVRKRQRQAECQLKAMKP